MRLCTDKYWLRLCFLWQAAEYLGSYISHAGLFIIVGIATLLRDGRFGIQTPVRVEDFAHYYRQALGPMQWLVPEVADFVPGVKEAGASP
jgi:hypothetical protein